MDHPTAEHSATATPQNGHLSSQTVGFATTLLLATGLFLYLFLDEGVLALELWGKTKMVPGAGATLSMAALIGAWAGRRRLIRPIRFQPAHDFGIEPKQISQILESQANASAGLALLGDKKLILSSTGQCFIMYAVKNRSWVALFDPVGPVEHWPETVRLFIARARAAGCRPVFYQVSSRFLPLAIECGFVAHKLGEQAIVNLPGFDLKGGEWLKLRRSVNRAERDGLAFSWIPADQVAAHLPELRAVSDMWLNAHNAAEKGFSLGRFDNDYLCKSPVAIIRLEGRIVAFASVMTASSERDTFIDLMRHIPGTHRGMMDLLFVRIMEKLKADGFQTLNMGMAPLAGLSNHTCAPLWHRLCRFVFEHGEKLYNFRGVQSFKAKFDPQWQPRYLVAKGGALPLSALCDVTLLIAGGIKGVFKR